MRIDAPNTRIASMRSNAGLAPRVHLLTSVSRPKVLRPKVLPRSGIVLSEMRTADSLLISDLRSGYLANRFTPAEIMVQLGP